MEVIDAAAIFTRINHVDHGCGEIGQVLDPAHIGEGAVLLEEIPECDRVGDLSPFNQLGDRAENLAVDRIGEVVRPQEIRHPVIGVVVGQDGTQQRFFRLEIVGRRAERGEMLIVVERLYSRGILRSGCHGWEPNLRYWMGEPSKKPTP